MLQLQKRVSIVVIIMISEVSVLLENGAGVYLCKEWWK